MSRKEVSTKTRGVKIYQLDKDTNKIIATFDSIAEAGRHLGKPNVSHISAVCDGKRKIAYGFRWKKV
jgi:hypothetical protein